MRPKEPRMFHLRYGIIVMNNKTCRATVARVDTEDYPLVFLREWNYDPEEGYDIITLCINQP